MAAVVGRALVDRRRKSPYKRAKLFLNLRDIPHVLDRDRRLGGNGFQYQRHILCKGNGLLILIQGIDQLDYAQPFPVSVAHGHHQHGFRVIAGAPVIFDRPGKIIFRAMTHVLDADRPVFQKRQGAYVFPAQRHRRQIRVASVAAGIGMHRMVVHDLKAQRIPVPQIQRPRVAARQLHHACKDLLQQAV